VREDLYRGEGRERERRGGTKSEGRKVKIRPRCTHMDPLWPEKSEAIFFNLI